MANNCYKLIQLVMVTGLFAGQHNTKLHGTITGVISFVQLSLHQVETRQIQYNVK